MPELKRNFMQGRMNKDLDERLVSNGEYRDAMNIQVSTAEGSDVGTARNILSNKSLDLVSFHKPYAKRRNVNILHPAATNNLTVLNTPLVVGGEGRKEDNIIATTATTNIISSSAEVVGVVTDERENAIYSFIANAFDYETRPAKTNSAVGTVSATSTTTIVNDTVTINADIAASVAVGDFVFSNATTGILKGTKVVSVTDLGAVTRIVMDKAFQSPNPVGEEYRFHKPVSLGRKADLITKITPDTTNSKMQPIFVDVYEVRADWGFQAAASNEFNFTTAHSGGFVTYEDATHHHTGELTFTDCVNGIVPGMSVQAIDLNGNNIWANVYEGVYVMDVTVTGASVFPNPEITSTVLTLRLSKDVLLSQADAEAGVVLKFSNERILNFRTGTVHSYTDATLSGNTVSSATPENTKITAIDVVDDLLYFTTDYDEPKKINITKGLEGSKLNLIGQLGDTPNLYNTTRYYYEADDEQGVSIATMHEVMTKDDITVARLGPISAPELWMRDTKRLGPGGREAICNNVGLGGEISTVITSGNTHEVASDIGFFGDDNTIQFGTVDDDGDTVNADQVFELFVDPSRGSENAQETTYNDVNVQRFPYEGAWQVGDILDLYNGRHGYRVTVEITEVTIEPITHHFQYDENKITSIKVVILDANQGYIDSAAGDINSTTTPTECKWVAFLREESGVMYEDKFVRFAYRWRYNDGEVSPISPFSQPAFMPKSTYLYNAEEGQNEAISNNLKWLAITNFLGGGKITKINSPSFAKRRNSLRPIDIESVDILYKEDGNTNVYLLKNIKREGSVSSLSDIGDISTYQPISNWNHAGLQGGDKHIPLGNFANPLITGGQWGGNPLGGGQYPLLEDSHQGGEGGTLVPALNHNHLFDYRNGNASDMRGFFIVPPGAVGSVIPEMQVFRPFDAVPVSAKGQCISSSRIIYGNYQADYDLIDSNSKKISFNFSERSSSSINTEYGFGLNQGLGIFDVNGFTPSGFIFPTIKRGRTYTIGVVFKDRYGRESSVILGKDSALSIDKKQHRSGVSALKIAICPKGTIPYWAEFYKYFIKENSNEYYNLAMHAAYPAKISGEAASEYWIAFNSSERNKIQEDDILMVSKPQDHFTGTRNKTKYKVLAISNEAPNPKFLPDESEHPNPELPEGVTIPDEDKKGKFFVKIKANAELRRNFRNATTQIVSTRSNPVVFETMPDSGPDLDIYYEIGNANPVYLWNQNIQNFIEPGDQCLVRGIFADGSVKTIGHGSAQNEGENGTDTGSFYDRMHNSIQSVYGSPVKGLNKSIVKLRTASVANAATWDSLQRAWIQVYKKDKSCVSVEIDLDASDAAAAIQAEGSNFKTFLDGTRKVKYDTDNCVYYIKSYTWGLPALLRFHNAFSYGNGVETNRILDKFNAPKIDNGVKVSTVSSNYKRKHFKHGLIFSGIYNSKNSVNNLNQFITAEGITKDLNPEYGSIQKLFSRNTDIVAFCEDKILKILSSKDALFNADGNTNLTASNRVLGQAIPFAGDHGISRNPESFAENEYRVYFTDRARGAVLRLSKDGLTKISEIGMKDYFADTLNKAAAIIGSFNSKKDEYDVTIHSNIDSTNLTKEVNTLSFNESTNGWVSFRGYALEQGVSLNNIYYTFKDGQTWQHGLNPGNAARNNFYGVQYYSSITPVVNDMPSSIKSFNTLNYEGSQARIIQVADDSPNDGVAPGHQEYYNNIAREGWYVESIITDQQEGSVVEFKEKEGKWFNNIKGTETTWSNTLGGGDGSGSGNLDPQEFSFQGIDTLGASIGGDNSGVVHTITATMSTNSADAPTIVGDSDSILNGTNADTITSTVTLTAASGFVLGDIDLDADALDAVSSVTPTISYEGVSYDVNTDIPTSGESSVTLTITYSATAVTSNLDFDLGFSMTSIALVNHDLALCFEFFANGTEGISLSDNNQPYTIEAEAVSSDYTLTSAGSEITTLTDTFLPPHGNIHQAVFQLSGVDINPTNGSTHVASYTITCDDGFNLDFVSNLLEVNNIQTDVSNNNKLQSTNATIQHSGGDNNLFTSNEFATLLQKNLFNFYADAADGNAATLSSANGRYNLAFEPGFNIQGQQTSLTVKIFYNPTTGGTDGQVNVDFFRVPAISFIQEDIELPFTPTTSTEHFSGGGNITVIFEDVDMAANNPYSIAGAPNSGVNADIGQQLTSVFTNQDFEQFSSGVNTTPDPDTEFVAETYKINFKYGVNNDIYNYFVFGFDVPSDDQINENALSDNASEYLNNIWQCVLVPNLNQICTVANITSWNGVPASDGYINAVTGNLHFKNSNFFNAANLNPGETVVDFPQTLYDDPGTFLSADHDSNNQLNIFSQVKEVIFKNRPQVNEDGTIEPVDSGSNTVLMEVHWSGLPMVYHDNIIGNGNPNEISAEYFTSLSPARLHITIPTPIMSSSTTVEVINHKYSLWVNEIIFIKPYPGSSTQHMGGYTLEGLDLTQTEASDYDAYNWDGTTGTSADATLSTISHAQLHAGTGGSNPSGSTNWSGQWFAGPSGTFYRLNVHGTYASGKTLTHQVTYTAGLVDSQQTEFVALDLNTAEAFPLTDQATIEGFFPDDGNFIKPFSLNSFTTQKGFYTYRIDGTFVSNTCRTITFDVIYQTDGSGVDIDADFPQDPLILSPSGEGRIGASRDLVIARRVIP